MINSLSFFFFFFQAEDGIRVFHVTGVQTCALPISYAKANPGKISYGSGGVGTSVHLSGELFKRMTGREMTHVSYRGSAPSLQDVIAGRLDLIFDNVTPSLPHVRQLDPGHALEQFAGEMH